MTRDAALNLRSFKHYCTCGGYAWQLNGRDQESPHTHWCPQYEEYRAWRLALRQPKKDDSDGRPD